MVSKCPFGKSSPSPGAGTHTPHKNRFTSQNKPGSECRSFQTLPGMLKHGVLPTCAWLTQRPCRSKEQLIPWVPHSELIPGLLGLSLLGSPHSPNSSCPGSPGLCTPAPSQENTAHTPRLSLRTNKVGIALGPICKVPTELSDGTELSLTGALGAGKSIPWEIADLQSLNLFFGKQELIFSP